jgi:hypothetical protein
VSSIVESVDFDLRWCHGDIPWCCAGCDSDWLPTVAQDGRSPEAWASRAPQRVINR